jgi:hypothetical protein
MDATEALKQLSRDVEAARKKVRMTGKQAFDLIVMKAKRNYTGRHGYFVSEQKVVMEGEEMELEFHHVGHNASHSFSIALLPDGRLISRSYCANCAEDVIEYGVPAVEENITIHGTAQDVDFPSYLGHY